MGIKEWQKAANILKSKREDPIRQKEFQDKAIREEGERIREFSEGEDWIAASFDS